MEVCIRNNRIIHIRKCSVVETQSVELIIGASSVVGSFCFLGGLYERDKSE